MKVYALGVTLLEEVGGRIHTGRTSALPKKNNLQRYQPLAHPNQYSMALTR